MATLVSYGETTTARENQTWRASDHVRVAVEAAGINFADMLIINGQYQEKPPLPFIPGGECAGVGPRLVK